MQNKLEKNGIIYSLYDLFLNDVSKRFKNAIDIGAHYPKHEPEKDNTYYPDSLFDSFITSCKRSNFKAYSPDEEDVQASILVESFIPHPGYQLRQALLAVYISNILEEPVAVLFKNDRPSYSRLFSAFGISNQYFVENITDKTSLPKCMYKACGKILGIDTKSDILRMEVNGINIGRAIYNTYLREEGVGTIKKLDGTLLKRVCSSLLYTGSFIKFFNRKGFNYIVQGETNYTPWAELGESALTKGLMIFSPKGRPSHTTVRIYCPGDSLSNSQFGIKKSELEVALKSYKNIAKEEGKRIITNRINGNPRGEDEVDFQAAFGKEKRKVSEGKIRKQFEWNNENPIVCILPHVMVDAVNQCDGMVYPDYYTWLEETLCVISEISDVNWLIKPHPSEELFRAKHTTSDIFSKESREEHLQLCPDNVNTRSLFKFAKAVVTVRGTAGLECSCFGIPAILAGKSVYSGFGFTIDCSSDSEYRAALEDVSTLSGLSEEKVERARVIAGLRYSLLGVKSSMIPVHSPTSEIDVSEFWKSAEDKVSNNDMSHDKMYIGLKKQIEDETLHIWNPKLV